MGRLQVAVLLLMLMFAGCDSGRLEKQNAELKAQIAKDTVARDFDLQAKCSKDARVWFNVNWQRDKDTVLLDFSNHYNAQNNKCFIFVEYHYNSRMADAGGSSWTNDMNVWDVYENAKYADFTENHFTYYKPTIHVGDEVITCDVQGTKCKTANEFNNLIRPYMNN